MRKILFVSMVFLLLFGSVLANDKKPFTIEALYKIKYVGSPRISPDGNKIAFVVSENDLPKSKRNSDIYLMDIDGKNLKQMTTFDGGDWHPSFSDDGKFIIFFSTRKDGTQLWKLPISGGEAQQITSLDCNGINNPLFTKDGKNATTKRLTRWS